MVSSWPTCWVDQADLELTEIYLLYLPSTGVKVCALTQDCPLFWQGWEVGEGERVGFKTGFLYVTTGLELAL